MTTIPSPAEQKARSALPITRFITAYMPVSLSNRLLKFSVDRMSVIEGVRVEPVTVDGVDCLWIVPENSAEDDVLLYLHGGGFVLGLTPLHINMVGTLAQKMGVRALMVDYRLAPQHPFPAALDDCVTAYRWLLQQGHAAENIVIAGDSAGGNLSITTTMKLRDSGDLLPAAVACLSPVLDLASLRAGNEFDPLLHPRAMKFFNRSYVANHDPDDPYISPAFGDWRGMPPMLIHAGEDEILRHDALRAETIAQEAGVEVRLKIYPHMWHVWQIHLDLPQTMQSLEEIAAFLTEHLEAVIKK